MVSYPSLISSTEAWLILIYGLSSIFLEYAVDHQKEVFRASQGKCMIWGKPADFLVSILTIFLQNIGVLKPSPAWCILPL